MERWATRAIRGAITVDADDAELIVGAAQELIETVVRRNRLDIEEITSIFYTVTPDLKAAFPAEGARRAGLVSVPLMCATEVDVPGAQPRCIRCLVHVNTTRRQDEMVHAYLREAKALRPDWGGAVT